MEVERAGVDGRRLTRHALADAASEYACVWRAAEAMQRANPAMREVGLARNADPVEAAHELVPILAFTHPAVAPAIAGFLEAVGAELSEAVTPPCEHAFVGSDEIVGGQQQQDRLAELEDENEELRQRVQRLEAAMTMARAAMERAAEEPTA